MHSIAELALPLAIVEGLLFFLFLAAQRRLGHLSSAPNFNPMDNGPWWSVWFHRVWLVCHLPALAFQVLCGWVVRRPVAFKPTIFHLSNFVLLLLASSF